MSMPMWKLLSRGLPSPWIAPVLLAILVAGSCATTKSEKVSLRREPPREPWREARPAPGPTPEFKLPVFQKAELKNGLTVIVVEEHSLPTVEVSVVVRAGSASESAKEAGLAALTFALLDEGAGTMNNLALANELGALGTTLHTYARSEEGIARVQLLKKHVDRGLEILATVVRRPTFATSDVERVRDRLVGELKAREGDPGAIAAVVGDALVFGADHPYGHDARGTVASLKKLTAARVKRFWAERAGPRNAALVLAGDVTLEEAKALAEKHFGKWSGGPRASKPPADPKPRSALKIAMVDIPGAPQTSIRLSRAVMSRGDPDEAALIILNEILGGSFSSRLNLKLREEKQWTYGAWSYADRRLGKGSFVVGADVQAANTVDAVAEILAQLDAVVVSGASDEEIARAKEGWVKSLPGVLGLPGVQLDAATTLFSCYLAPDYHERLVERVNAVTVDDVKRVAARVLLRDDFVLVLAGDKATVEPKLKERSLGDVVFYGRDGAELK